MFKGIFDFESVLKKVRQEAEWGRSSPGNCKGQSTRYIYLQEIGLPKRNVNMLLAMNRRSTVFSLVYQKTPLLFLYFLRCFFL